MDRSHLKNAIILILALLNLFLLFSLFRHNRAQWESREQAVSQTVALFDTNGIRLSPDAISQETPPPGKSFIRDTDAERALISAFLGEHLSVTDQGGGIFTYGSKIGAARFSSDGSFDVLGTQIQTDAESFCRRFCREYGYKNLERSLDEQGSGTIQAVRFFDHVPIFNSTVRFTIEQGAITKVHGTFLPEHSSSLSQDEAPLSVLAALTIFLDLHESSESPVSAISSIELAYELQDSVNSSLSLIPAWCLCTDTGFYYVNCYTGTLTLG